MTETGIDRDIFLSGRDSHTHRERDRENDSERERGIWRKRES